ncbi:MAG TPA: pitrilysin family protein [Candidatus Saccharimonadales bacterium]|nr:pitrilysin family protein [Candidatus Saccharimonadales bacterium]
MLTLADFNVERKETFLSSGTRFVHFYRPNMPLSIDLVAMAGSKYNAEGKEGTAHFLEHILTAGTKDFPTKDKLAEFIEDLGGSMSASTGPHNLSLKVAVGDPNDAASAIKLLSEELLNSLFADKAVESERSVILKELGTKKSNPVRILADISRSLLYQKTDIGRSNLGSDESIKSITKDDLLEFYKLNFNSNRIAIISSGGADFESMVELCEKNLLLPNGPKPDYRKEIPILRDKLISIEKFTQNDTVNISFDFRSAFGFDKDVNALIIMAMIIGGGRASTLNKRLRYDKGLVYSVKAGAASTIDAGSFGVFTSTSKIHVQEVLNIICDEIKRLSIVGITQEELNFAKNKIIKSKRMSLQTSESWVDWHTAHTLYDESSWTIEDYLKEINSVTIDDTKRVASKYLNENNWYLSMTGDIEESEVKVLFDT